MSIVGDDDAYITDAGVVVQKLSQTCSELDNKKADKEFVLSLINAVSASPLSHVTCAGIGREPVGKQIMHAA